MKSLLISNKGLTLVEILASITILSIIIIPLFSIFVLSAKTNNESEKMISATYVAQTNMELIYDNSTKYSLGDGMKGLSSEGFHQETCDSNYCFTKSFKQYIVKVVIDNKDNLENSLVHVIVKVFHNMDMGNLEAQMETIMQWKE